HSAASGAGPRHQSVPLLRADLLGVSVGGTAWLASRRDARHFDRRLSGGLRAIRLLDGLGGRDDHGLRSACRRDIGSGGARARLSRRRRRRERVSRMAQDKSVAEQLWAIAIWALVIFFVVNVMATIAAVAVNSLGTRWFGAWLPAGFTTRWYISAWGEFQLDDVLIVTFQVVGAVVLFSGLIGVPAAYAVARRDFPAKLVVIVLFLL